MIAALLSDSSIMYSGVRRWRLCASTRHRLTSVRRGAWHCCTNCAGRMPSDEEPWTIQIHKLGGQPRAFSESWHIAGSTELSADASPGTCRNWPKNLACQPHNDVHHGGYLTMSTMVDTYLKVNQGRVGDQRSVAL